MNNSNQQDKINELEKYILKLEEVYKKQEKDIKWFTEYQKIREDPSLEHCINLYMKYARHLSEYFKTTKLWVCRPNSKWEAQQGNKLLIFSSSGTDTFLYDSGLSIGKYRAFLVKTNSYNTAIILDNNNRQN